MRKTIPVRTPQHRVMCRPGDGLRALQGEDCHTAPGARRQRYDSLIEHLVTRRGSGSDDPPRHQQGYRREQHADAKDTHSCRCPGKPRHVTGANRSGVEHVEMTSTEAPEPRNEQRGKCPEICSTEPDQQPDRRPRRRQHAGNRQHHVCRCVRQDHAKVLHDSQQPGLMKAGRRTSRRLPIYRRIPNWCPPSVGQCVFQNLTMSQCARNW